MNRRALVVGVGGGVGLELAKRLLRAGYHVVGTVADQEESRQVYAEAPAVERAFVLDLANAGRIPHEIAKQGLGPLDAVIVCGAFAPHGPLETMPLAALRRTFEINTVSGVAIYQACLPLLRTNRGRLVLMSSFAGKVGIPFIGHFVASKFALEGLADVMRREARPWGVEVILVQAGELRSKAVSGQMETIDRDRAALAPDIAALYGSLYDRFAGILKRGWDTAVEPDEVARTIVEALQAERPAARYQVGEDAKFLCNVAARRPDDETDEIVAGFMAPG